MSFFIDNGALCLDYNGKVISGSSTALEVVNERGSHLELVNGVWETDGERAYSAIGNQSKIILTAKESAFGILLSAKLQTGKTEGFEKVFKWYIRCFLPQNPKSVLYNDGTYNPGKCIFDMTAKAITTALVADQEIHGVDYVAYQADEDDFGVVGAVTFDKYFTNVSLSENGMTTIYIAVNEHLRGTVDLEKDTFFETDCILISMGETDVLPTYGKAIAALNGVEKKFTTPIGWCSWYYYGPNISEDIIRENMEIEILYEQYPYDRELLDGIYDLILETVLCKNGTVFIASNEYPVELVKGKFLKLNSSFPLAFYSMPCKLISSRWIHGIADSVPYLLCACCT